MIVNKIYDDKRARGGERKSESRRGEGEESSRQATLLFWFRLLRDEFRLAMCSLSVFTCVSNVLLMLLRPTSPPFVMMIRSYRGARRTEIRLWLDLCEPIKGDSKEEQEKLSPRRHYSKVNDSGSRRRQRCQKCFGVDALRRLSNDSKGFRKISFCSFQEQEKAFSRMKDALGSRSEKPRENIFILRPTIPLEKATPTPSLCSLKTSGRIFKSF
jgi:hypothetical protein